MIKLNRFTIALLIQVLQRKLLKFAGIFPAVSKVSFGFSLSTLPGEFFPHPSNAGIGCVTCFGQWNVSRSVQCQLQTTGSLCPFVLGPRMTRVEQTCTQEPDQRNLLNRQEQPDGSPSAVPCM